MRGAKGDRTRAMTGGGAEGRRNAHCRKYRGHPSSPRAPRRNGGATSSYLPPPLPAKGAFDTSKRVARGREGWPLRRRALKRHR